MAEITAKMVSDLRAETGAGMMDCKKALTEANGDIEEAQTILRKKGAAKAGAKIESRTASEGILDASIAADGSKGALLELNCETDFVARNEDFKALTHELAELAVSTATDTTANFGATSTASGKTVAERVTEAVTRLGEKIVVARVVRFDVSAGVVGAYVHKTDFKTGVLVEIGAAGALKDKASAEQLARDVAMHIAAARPEYLNPDEVPTHLIDKEIEIAKAKQDADPNFASKPEAAKKAMIDGQVRKYLEQTVLVEQAYVKDPSGKQKIKDLVAAASKTAGATLKIARFARYRVGEGAAEASENA